jgi:5-methyltetrahydrofolate--homocysteine methyltransferase
MAAGRRRWPHVAAVRHDLRRAVQKGVAMYEPQQSEHGPLAALQAARSVLVADGGMGTSLFAAGLATGDSPELWNVERPDAVAAVHRAFVDAGADIILTNTFGGTRSRLELHGLEGRVAQVNAAGVAVARRVADAADRPVVVAGSVGPTGSLFEPLGPLTIETGTELFREQMEALAAAGADVVWIETLSAVDELEAAVAAAQTTGLPIVSTMSFDTHGKTMMGVSPRDLAAWWQRAGVPAPAAIGANCGIGPADGILAAMEIHQAAPEIAVVVKANCGVPEIVDGRVWYPASSTAMSEYARLAVRAGIRIVGACCGSTPEHIRQIRDAVDTTAPGVAPDRSEVESALGAAAAPASPRSRSRRRSRSG